MKRQPPDAGSASVEVVIVAPLLMLIAVAVVGLGRVAQAHLEAEGVAGAAARAASLARSPRAAVEAAKATAVASGHASCPSPEVSVDTAGFRPGGVVTVTVTCRPLSTPAGRCHDAWAPRIAQGQRVHELRHRQVAIGWQPMKTRRSSSRRPSDEGSLTVFVVIVFAGLMMFAGIVADGGAALDAKVHALHAASEAARMGAEELDIPTYHRSGHRVLKPTDAAAAARRFLASVQADGTVSATEDSVTVHASTTHRTWLLSLVGVDTFTMTADATAKPEATTP